MLPGSLLSSQSDPFPLSSDDDSAHTVLDAAGEKMLVGNGLWPEYSQNSPNVLVMVNRQFVQVAVTHPPAFCMSRIFSCILRRVEGTQLLYSLILVFYWDLTSHILKAFLALLRQFLMSLPARKIIRLLKDLLHSL